MLYIHPDECVDCGACEPVCPVEAIFYEDDVPEQWKDYTRRNDDFFEELGSPGGASKVGKIDKDRRRSCRRRTHHCRRPPRPAALGRAAGLPVGSARAAKARAAAHPDGIVDLSIGTPVDPVPAVIRAALAGRGRLARLPLTGARPQLRAAIPAWWSAAAARRRRRRRAADDRLQGARRLAADAARARSR